MQTTGLLEATQTPTMPQSSRTTTSEDQLSSAGGGHTETSQTFRCSQSTVAHGTTSVSMQQGLFRKKERHGRKEQARAKEREEAKARQQNNRRQGIRREEALAQENGDTGLDGMNGEPPPQVPGRKEPTTTIGTNGRNHEKHKTK